MKKVLITGIAGFAGSHLAEYILENHKDAEIFGTILENERLDNISHIQKQLRLIPCDINDASMVSSAMEKVLPDTIFHLAAQSYIHSSWEDSGATLKTNIIGQSNFFEAVRKKLDAISPTILITCSSEEYGYVRQNETPIQETNDLRPRSPYAVSKIAQDYMGYQYWEAYKMKVIRMRAFNHTGPRRAPIFFVSSLAKKVAELERGMSTEPFKTRDLSAVRDFSDVRDIVKGYAMAVASCSPGDVYNICSGKGLVLREIVDTFIKLSKAKNMKLVRTEEGTRPTDGGVVIGDHSKFFRATGWKPNIDFLGKTIPDMLDWWRKHL